MPILIGRHEFKGPVTASQVVPQIPGLYAVLYQDNLGLSIVQMAESVDLSKTAAALKNAKNTSLVFFPCRDPIQRKTILKDLMQEYEYEDETETALPEQLKAAAS